MRSSDEEDWRLPFSLHSDNAFDTNTYAPLNSSTDSYISPFSAIPTLFLNEHNSAMDSTDDTSPPQNDVIAESDGMGSRIQEVQSSHVEKKGIGDQEQTSPSVSVLPPITSGMCGSPNGFFKMWP